jgi:CubicO group peptidase (beta-lactamase class C family)
MDVCIGGHIEPGFAAVERAFAQNFEAGHETGAAFCLHVDGRKVVDLYGGSFDRNDRPYDQDTLQLVFSSTKGATAACANLLAQRGELDLESPVARYWPEFAQFGKEEIPVLFLLSHQAGLPALDASLSPEEVQAWDPVIAALEAQTPFWEPGTAHGYHAVTYGWLVGEVVRRVTGRSLGTFFAEEIAQPLGLEFWIGLPEEEEHRVSPLTGGVLSAGEAEGALSSDFSSTLLARALNAGGAFSEPGWANRRAWHAAEVPAANGITNATSLSRAGGSGPYGTHRRGRSGVRVGGLHNDAAHRTGVLDLQSLRALRRLGLVRAHRRRRIVRLRRSREQPRSGLRHEQNVDRHDGRPAVPAPHPSLLRGGGGGAEIPVAEIPVAEIHRGADSL